LALATFASVVGLDCHAQPSSAPPHAASIELRTPNWSGSWSTFFGPLEASSALERAIRPEKRAEYRELIKQYLTAQVNFRDLYCRPYLFGGFSEGAEGDIEFTYAPGEVVLLWEGGLVRRIYLDGRGPDPNQQIAKAGNSRGLWDGDTLVVDTELNPDAGPFLGYLNTPTIRVGRNAHLAERIHLKDADTLEFDLTLIAPELLADPVKMTVDYHRDRGYVMGEYTRCTQSDRSLDAKSGRIGYDTTPPADLPPPPK
jgi:hypothetical protein